MDKLYPIDLKGEIGDEIMDEREFRRMLERYPVVRTRNHARVEWNSLESGADGAAASVSVPTHDQTNAIEPTQTLAAALDTFLSPYFSSTEVARITRELEKAQADFLSGLCLEDVNDICAQFVEAKH